MKLYEFLDRFGDLDQMTFCNRFSHPFLLETRDFLEAEQERRLFLVRGTQEMPLVIGRGPQCHIPIRDPMVSTKHAELVPPKEPNSPWHVVDRGSTNGTYINRKRLQPNAAVPLQDGTVLQFGQASFFEFLHVVRFLREAETLRMDMGDRDEQTEMFGATLHGQVMAPAFDMQAMPREKRSMANSAEILLFCDGLDPVAIDPGKSLVLGRKAENADVVLAHQHVSRRHAEVQRRADGIFVRDLGSANGSFVDSLSLRLGTEWAKLHPGQVLLVGPFRITVGLPQGSSANLGGQTLVMNAADDKSALKFQMASQPLNQMLERVEEEKHTGTLIIHGQGVMGTVTFLDGKPCDAQTNDGKTGADAVLRLLEEKQGSYVLKPTIEQATQRKIERSFGEIMLDHFLSHS